MASTVADLARSVSLWRGRAGAAVAQLEQVRDGAIGRLVDVGSEQSTWGGLREPATAGGRPRWAHTQAWLLQRASSTVTIALPSLLLGRHGGVGAGDLVRATGDLGWGSTRLVDGPHLELLRLAAARGGDLTDAEIESSRYWRLGAACLSLAGRFHGAHTEPELLQVARDFIASGLDDGCAPAAAEPGGTASILVAPVVGSSSYSILEGHHRAALAAFHGASEIPAISLRIATRTPLQAHLGRMSWLSGERHRLYQPLTSPDLGRDWVTVRRCDDRLSKMTAAIDELEVRPADSSYVDLACCYGWFVAEMSEAGFRSIGVERDPLVKPLGMYAYGLDESQLIVGDVWDWLRSTPPRGTTIVSCFSLIQHILMAGGESQLRDFVQLLDRATGRALFIDSGQDHERMYARHLQQWNAETIKAFLNANTTFDEITDLGPDTDGIGEYEGNYGRHLFACIRRP